MYDAVSGTPSQIVKIRNTFSLSKRRVCVSASTSEPVRRVRADAQRNIDALIAAAREVFATSGVDAPVREITTKAGVGLATFYRHFPERSDLATAVFRTDV